MVTLKEKLDLYSTEQNKNNNLSSKINRIYIII